MPSPSKDLNKHNLNDWKKFSNYLWFNEELNIWMHVQEKIIYFQEQIFD